MKIRVEGRTGQREIITIVPPVTNIHEGAELSYLSCGDGTDHFFTLDGFYDGWGRSVDGITVEQAGEEIQKI